MRDTITFTKRIFKSGSRNFLRNRTVSFSSVAILSTTLMIIGAFFFFRGIFDYSLEHIKNKVDIKIYFKLESSQEEIDEIKNKIIALPEVEKVVFTSAEQSLIDFKNSHASDPVTLQALDEIGKNPFGAMLTIIAKDTNSYESIANSLNSNSQFLGNSYTAIDKINYIELKSTINRLNNIIKWINVVGYWVTLLFIFMTSLIIFNTIRLSIFIFKEEISVMKLVGASDTYIKGPFLVESAIYAITSVFFTMIIFFPVTYYLSKKTVVFLSGLDIFNYYISNFFSLFFLLLLVSLVLSFISSLLAIRKYLKV